MELSDVKLLRKSRGNVKRNLTSFKSFLEKNNFEDPSTDINKLMTRLKISDQWIGKLYEICEKFGFVIEDEAELESEHEATQLVIEEIIDIQSHVNAIIDKRYLGKIVNSREINLDSANANTSVLQSIVDELHMNREIANEQQRILRLEIENLTSNGNSGEQTRNEKPKL